jgi:predicted MFS family arabinose efflux permease
MAGLALLPCRLFDRAGAEGGAQAPAAARLDRRRLRALLGGPSFLFFSLLMLRPGALLSVGVLNYFLPLFLHDAGVAQSDIGRIFMCYCLIVIYAGPKIEALAVFKGRVSLMVFCGGMAGAAAAAGFIFLPPVQAALSGVFFLGLATCCNIPGQSAYLLRLPAARSLGVEFSLSVLNTVERVGQMLGPLCIGSLLAGLSVPRLALGSGAAIALASLLFLLYSAVKPEPASGARGED